MRPSTLTPERYYLIAEDAQGTRIFGKGDKYYVEESRPTAKLKTRRTQFSSYRDASKYFTAHAQEDRNAETTA
jgi:hypothetical protein